jgi:ATP-dependent DNA helicase RecG
MQLQLDTSVQYIPGVGPKRAEILEKLEIHTAKDFLYHFPFRYNDFSIISPIASLQAGEMVTIKATVSSIKAFRTKTGKRMQQAIVSDETNKMTITWFNQEYLLRVIKPEHTYHFSGEVSWFGHMITMMSPVFEEDQISESLHTGRLVPVYHETEGVTSKWIRAKMRIVLDTLKEQLIDILPTQTQNTYNLISIQEALEEIHYPKNHESLEIAKKRLAFEELFLLHIQSYIRKYTWESQTKAYPLSIDPEDLQKLITSLPYDLTIDQITTIKDIVSDLEKTVPMNRMVLGDVGAGKTIVAALASYIAYRSGKSTLLMAPTQILASQHAATFKELFSPLGIDITLITGGPKESSDVQELSLFRQTQKPIIAIGTHALLHENFSNHSIGLVIVDEQQRFGVHQRQILNEKDDQGAIPHLLTMTATPIPRTIALTILGNLAISIIETMPKGRLPVKTWVVPKIKREGAYVWIKKQINTLGIQVFILCPFIDESDSIVSVKAATVEFEILKKQIFPDLKLALLHGRMKGKEKTEILNKFREKKYDILVSTPVVEVGVDIPYATIMMVEGADRFGLAQLHQLRGRVGRRELQSYCLLFTDSDDEGTITRLKAMERFQNGIELATFDLRIRGPGEVFGTRQHGIPNLKIASFFDMDLIEETKRAVTDITTQNPDLSSFPHLREIGESGTISDGNN